MLCVSLQGAISADPVTQQNWPLPEPAVHPFPAFLQQSGIAQNTNPTDDYFDRVQSSPMGYLLWSRFPVSVFLPSPPINVPPAELQRFQRWDKAVRQAIADWQIIFPLQVVGNAEDADIQIFYRDPPLDRQVDPKTGLIKFGRARTAQTRYEFYWSQENPPHLRHRMTIDIKPGLAPASLTATARHELGHALGIWGHSDRPEDTLYPAQSPAAALSPRDLNTLYRLYQQPTRLGWPTSIK